jgi:hypothetical protein
LFEFKILISNTLEDKKLANAIRNTLERVSEFKAYFSEEYPIKGEDFTTKLQNAIEDCDFMVAIFTKDSINDQLINQEIGYAYKVKQINKKLKILIVTEINLELSGLVRYANEEIIKMDKRKIDLLLHNIIWSIRKSIPNGLSSNTLKLKIKCCGCRDLNDFPNEFFGVIPSQTEIKKNYSTEKNTLNYYCPYCGASNEINVLSFENMSLTMRKTLKEETSLTI